MPETDGTEVIILDLSPTSMQSRRQKESARRAVQRGRALRIVLSAILGAIALAAILTALGR